MQCQDCAMTNHVHEHEHSHKHHHEEKSPKIAVFRIVAALLLLIAAWLLPLTGFWKLTAFAIPYLLVGSETICEATKNILHGELFDEAFLMTVATLGAFAIGEYPEAVGVMIFFQIGELCEHLAVEKSRRSITGLMDIRPDHAVLLRDGKEIAVSPEEVQVGDILRVKAGEKIPLDGVILSGQTTVHTAALTGESVPVEKGVGDKVLSGSVNLNGVITMQAESNAHNSTVSRILELVEHASEKKAYAEAFITRFSRRYTPCVVIAALLLGIVPPLAFGQAWTEWLRRACMFLMVSCPCALVVSVPLSFFGGIGGASRIGVLMKGANHLEMLSKIDTVVFDKTGTLTEGKFAVDAVYPVVGTADALLKLAAAIEQNSVHPAAISILNAYCGSFEDCQPESTEELAGMGVHAVLNGRNYYAGNEKLMQKIGVSARKCDVIGTIVHIAAAGEYLGYLVIRDRVKADAKEAIALLCKEGIQKTVMLTGDLCAAAEDAAKQVGIDEVQAELLPVGKVEAMEGLLAEGRRTAFVGDGINDAPVLMRADLGIAMGGMGSEAAMEAADIVLMDDKLEKLPIAIGIARKTMRIVRENIGMALMVKAIILLLSAFGIANMWMAVFADVGVLLVAVMNALRCMGNEA